MGKITAIKKLKRLYRVDLSGFDDEDKIYLSEDTIVHFFLNVDKRSEEHSLNSSHSQQSRMPSSA